MKPAHYTLIACLTLVVLIGGAALFGSDTVRSSLLEGVNPVGHAQASDRCSGC